MAEHRQIEGSSELVYLPRPSSAPIFLAIGVATMVIGIYGEGFLFRGWVWAIFGAAVLLAALRSLITSSVRDYYSRPRVQRSRSAVLPAASLRAPSRSE